MMETPTPQYELDPQILQHVLPDAPGVYLFKERSGRILYVGKAKSLKKRVLSYFRAPSQLSHKTQLMMKRAVGLDFVLTGTEKEAFILEDTLVKKSMPRYNVILRDDKRFPSLRLDLREPYPRLTVARKIKRDGALYFGPFASANSVRSTLRVIDRVFQMRKCKTRDLPKRTRPCLNYEMGRCLGACVHPVPREEYHKTVHRVRLFLEGRNRELMDRLREDMREASERLDFEKAARCRDQIRAVERTLEHQHVVSPRLEDQDVIGLASEGEIYQVVLLRVRKGAVVDTRDYLLRNPGGETSEVLEAFLKQYYARVGFIPKEILTPQPVDDLTSIQDWICDLSGRKVSLRHPRRGEKRRLIDLAQKNAENLLAARKIGPQDVDLMELAQSVLGLQKVPRYIEGVDISNLQGDQAVGTVVAFVEGNPQPSGYRNYKIKAIQGIDDYGMMGELVSRRLHHGQLPDLLVVDGGKGHLSAVSEAIRRHGRSRGDLPEVISIAKPDGGRGEKIDKVYLPGRKNPLRLKPDHPVLLWLMKIRDEAHRRAVSYHRGLRQNALTDSMLDAVPGIGEKRKRLLLRRFRDVQAIAEASVADLIAVPGIQRSLAESILLHLNRQEGDPELEAGSLDIST